MAQLSPQLALRIGLAARTLPDVPPARLMRVLLAALAYPLTDQKLKSITVKQLRTARQGDLRAISSTEMEAAARYLWDRAGVDIIDPSIPAPEPYRDGDMPGAVRVAIASNDGLECNGDFGNCLRYLVFQVSTTQSRLIDVRATGGEKAADDRAAWRADVVHDCQLIFATSIGIRTAAKLVKGDTYLVTQGQSGSAAEAIASIQRVLRNGPPPWLAKIAGTGTPNRVAPSRHFAPQRRAA
jgi:nitrogen fixation protein NifX